MLHRRHYTVDEAEALRGWVAAHVRRLRLARRRLRAPRVARALAGVDADRGGAWPGGEAALAALGFVVLAQQLREAEVIVRDLDRGLVDFPALRDGEEIYLCWLIDEPAVAYWHRPETGFQGRQPL